MQYFTENMNKVVIILGQPIAVAGYSFVPLNVATTVGVLYVSVVLINFIWGILSSLLSTCTRKSLTSYGEWAVVTGGSEGIGLAYATELAKQGLKVVIISRSAAKLAVAKESIEKRVKNATVKTIAADMADVKIYASGSGLSSIERSLKDAGVENIGVLVNNVGRSYPTALLFDEAETIEPGMFSSLITLNCTALTLMTAVVVKGMKARKSGVIINIASAAGRMPAGSPYLAVYSGTKAYVDFLSRSLNAELSPFGIRVQCQSPYLVKSSLSGIKRSSLFTPEPHTYAKAAVADIGSGVSTVPYWPHALEDSIVQSLPTWFVAKQLVSMHAEIRRRYFSKKERDAKTAVVAATTTASAADTATSSSRGARGSSSSRAKKTT